MYVRYLVCIPCTYIPGMGSCRYGIPTFVGHYVHDEVMVEASTNEFGPWVEVHGWMILMGVASVEYR